MRITIIDYGVGNLRSVQRAFEALGYETLVSRDKKDLKNADVLVLPGQGAFAEAKYHLEKFNLIDLVKDHILSQKPYIGICLGFQLLFETSEENGLHTGLGVIKGQVKAFKSNILKIPHMGWNNIMIKNDDADICNSLGDAPHVYFVHSYYVETPDESVICTTTDYGKEFVSSVQKKNLFACQFHPEKSGDVGLKILRQFLDSIHLDSIHLDLIN